MDARTTVTPTGLLLIASMLIASGSAVAFSESREEQPAETAATEPASPPVTATAAAADAELRGLFAELEAAWQASQAEPKDTRRLESFQRLMAGFLNEAVNIHPESPWTLKGIELYSEWCLQTANEKSRRDRNHQAALRILDTARDYFEMIDAEPDPELLEAITRMERKVD